MSDTSTESPAEREVRLKCEKLEWEIRALRQPFRRNPALWLSCATAVVALGAVFLQTRLSRHEFILGEAKAVQAQNARNQAEAAAAQASVELESAKREIDQKKAELAKLDREILTATSLLAEASKTAPAEIKKQADNFLKDWRREHDPTGRFPDHVPPME